MSLETEYLDQTVIEVFDLGLLSNSFEKIVTIKQHQVVKMMLEFWQKDTSVKKSDITRIANEYKIIQVVPLNKSESLFWHLLLITQNGYRIYIQFDMIEAKQPSKEDLNSSYVNTENLELRRFSGTWHIAEIMFLPEPHSLAEIQMIYRGQTVFSGGSLHSAA
jgi:hypothetical protein